MKKNSRIKKYEFQEKFSNFLEFICRKYQDICENFDDTILVNYNTVFEYIFVDKLSSRNPRNFCGNIHRKKAQIFPLICQKKNKSNMPTFPLIPNFLDNK